MKASEISSVIEKSSPPPLESDEYGLIYGDPETEVERAGVLWRLNVDTLNRVGEDRINLLIVHEAPFQRARKSKWSYDTTPQYADRYDALIRELLDEYKIVVYRYHSNFDAWKEIGVADFFGTSLGFTRVVGQGMFTRTYLVNKVSLRELASHIEQKFPGCPVRIFGNPEKSVTRVSTMIGGFGGNQPLMPFEIKNQRGEVIILGDMTEKVLLNALESGIDVIETLHSITEEPALKKITEWLSERFPSCSFRFYASGAYLYNLRNHNARK
jgi:putative NIF3 family GTP cyclohydrolase 1 type 2